MRVIVSACLLGCNCKYNGGNNLCPRVAELARRWEVLLVCPELLAGAGVPREPVELVNGRLVNRSGEDVHALYLRGVEATLRQLDGMGAELAVLKARSPTCGARQVYDGSFSGRLVEGQGVFAQALRERGIPVEDEETV